MFEKVTSEQVGISSRDMASFARFVMNCSKYHGKRLMNEQYLRTATSKTVDNTRHNNNFKTYASYGYGYLIWHTEQGGFSLVSAMTVRRRRHGAKSAALISSPA